MILTPAAPSVLSSIATTVSQFASKFAGLFLEVGKTALPYLGTAYFSYQIGDKTYKIYIGKDDAELIERLTRSDCALTKMTPRVEGCYKKYLRDALFRLAEKNGDTASVFYQKFQSCFANRTEYPCSFWGVNVHDEM
jgi:hypothetical protein